MKCRRTMLLAIAAFAALCPVERATHAAEEIAWGEPENGLRIGISCEKRVIPSIERPRFTVHLQNVSDRRLTIPASSAFVPRTHDRLTAYFERPLYPIAKEVAGREPTYSVGGGQLLTSVTHEVETLAPGNTVVLRGVTLDEHYYAEESDSFRRRTELKRLWLFPQSSYLVGFGYRRESGEPEGKEVWSGNAVSAEIRIAVQKPSVAGYRIDGKLSLPKKDYFVGEPIYVKFEVTNRGNEPIYFPTGGDYRSTGRADRFSFTAVRTDGKEAEDPVQPGGLGGGLGGTQRVMPGGTYSETLLLNMYRALREVGDYTVTGKRTLNLVPEFETFWREEVVPAIRIEAKVSLTLHHDPEAMQEYLARLERRFAEGESYRAYDELRALVVSRSQPALPTVRKMALTPNPYRGSIIEFLARYGREEAEETLVRIARGDDASARREALGLIAEWGDAKHRPLIQQALQSRDTGERLAAVSLCKDFGPKGCFEQLMGMAKDEDPLVRRYLSAALAKYGDKRAIPVLLGLLKDPDPDHYIKIWAASSLGKLGRKDGVPVMIDLLRDEATQGYRGYIVHILAELTGNQFREDYSEWKDWWEKEGKSLPMEQDMRLEPPGGQVETKATRAGPTGPSAGRRWPYIAGATAVLLLGVASLYVRRRRRPAE